MFRKIWQKREFWKSHQIYAAYNRVNTVASLVLILFLHKLLYVNLPCYFFMFFFFLFDTLRLISKLPYAITYKINQNLINSYSKLQKLCFLHHVRWKFRNIHMKICRNIKLEILRKLSLIVHKLNYQICLDKMRSLSSSTKAKRSQRREIFSLAEKLFGKQKKIEIKVT